MDLLTSYRVDLSVVLQSATPLLIALAGLFMTGSLYELVATQSKYSIYPIILEASCILSFKGNVELSFAIHLSHFRNKPENNGEYVNYAFYNTNMVFLQSFIIGFVVGIIGAFYSLTNRISGFEEFLKILVVSIISCMFTTLLFVISLLIAIEFTKYFDLDSENFIMPLLNAIIDYLIVKYLIDFSISFEKLDLETVVLIGFLLSVFVCINAYFSSKAEMIVPVQSAAVLTFSFVLSVISGYLVDYFAKTFSFIPIVYPVLAGMSATITFIFLHRLSYTTIGRRAHLTSTHSTLVVIASIISTSYIILATLLNLNDSLIFSILFVFMFVTQTYALLLILEKIVEICSYENKDVSVFALPIISSVADIVGVLLLLGAGILISTTKYLI